MEKEIIEGLKVSFGMVESAEGRARSAEEEAVRLRSIYLDQFTSQARNITELIKKKCQSIDGYGTFFGSNIGTTYDELSDNVCKFIALDKYTALNSPDRLTYFSHVMLGCLLSKDFSEKNSFYFCHSKSNDSQFMHPMKLVASELELVIGFGERKGSFKGKEIMEIEVSFYHKK